MLINGQVLDKCGCRQVGFGMRHRGFSSCSGAAVKVGGVGLTDGPQVLKNGRNVMKPSPLEVIPSTWTDEHDVRFFPCEAS